MSENETIYQPVGGQLAEALSKAQGEFPDIPKLKVARVQTKTGGTYTYKYADLADVLKAVRPALSKYGLAFTQPLVRIEGKTYVTSRLLHKSGEILPSDGLELPTDIEDPQKRGIVWAYWRRYDGCSLLGIAPDEDADGDTGAAPKPSAKSVPDSKPASGKRTEKTETASEPAPLERADPPGNSNIARSSAAAAPAPPAAETKGDIPDGDQRKAYALAAQAFVPNKGDQKLLKDVLLKQTGKKEVTNVTHDGWRSFLKSVNVASEANKLDEFLGKSKSNANPDF